MGVGGLTSLIEENERVLLKPTELKDTRLLVDGSSLVYQLYFLGHVDFTFGGEYGRFAHVVRRFVSTLLAANVQPFLIFDGPRNPGDAKWETVLSRQRNRLAAAKYWCSKPREQKTAGRQRVPRVLPLFALDVLVQTVREMGVPAVHSTGEADTLLAALANAWDCPLLSQDSDFFIFDLSAGYIPFATVEWQLAGSDTTRDRIPCRLYRVSHLLDYFGGLDRQLLPLFAVVSGNDFAKATNFENFFANIHKPHVNKRRQLPITKKHVKMLALLHWMEDKTLAEAVAGILSHITKDKRAALETLIERALSVYGTDAQARKLGQQPTEQHVTSMLLDDMVAFFPHSPCWLLQAFVDGRVTAPVLSISLFRRSILPTLLEDFSKPSVYTCCVTIRNCVYAVLVEHSSSGFWEHVRIDGQFSKHQVQAPTFLDSIAIPDAWSVPHVSIQEKLRLFCGVCLTNVDQFCNLFDKRDWLLLLSVLYWCKSEETLVSRSLCAALLLSFSTDIRQWLEQHNAVDISQKPDIRLVHSLNQWQSTLQAFCWLNQALALPLTVPDLSRFDARSVCRVFATLRTRANAADCGVEHVVEEDSFDTAATQLCEKFFSLLSPTCLVANERFSQRRVVKHTGGLGRVNDMADVNEETSCANDETWDVSDCNGTGGLEEHFDLENKFDILMCL